ncbi:MAG: tRNA 2-thiouridine(34) synthase MnmA, partial [Dehalococcoidia bacterium]|nr:tRNA 2-thiouridine(34) synthase MnmA [Dehalococcoidia bacterium]
FVDDYLHGRTPNPCLACNQFVKFDPLLARAQALGCDYLATGHYARVDQHDGRYRLRKAVDPAKDQSYVLYTLGQRQLAKLLFPLGGMTKAQTRAIAASLQLPVADKPDSQEICFLQGRNYREFLAERVGEQPPGEVVTEDGVVVGSHRGAAWYTVGQRRGLGLAGPEPMYVLAIEPKDNRVVVGHESRLLKRALIAERVHWVSGEPPSGPIEVAAKVRYRAPETPAVAYLENDRLRVEFLEPQRALTPGQAVVLYRDDEVIGGATITAAIA